MTPVIHSRKLFNDNANERITPHFYELKGMSHALWNKIRRQNNLTMSKTLVESKIVRKKKCPKFIRIQREHLFEKFIQHWSTNLNGELFRIAAMPHGKCSEKQFNASKVFRWIKEHFISNINLKSNSIRLNCWKSSLG